MKQILLRIIRGLGYDVVKLKHPRLATNQKINRPLYVEFIGVSGVGKTTVYNQLKLQYKDFGVDFGEFMSTLTNFSIKQYRDHSFDERQFYQVLAYHKLENILQKENYKPFDKLRVLQYFYTVIVSDKIVQDFNKEYLIISEDGLFHNFANELDKTIKVDAPAVKEMQNRAIVHCYSSPAKVAQQILDRVKNGGHLVPQHKGLSFEELVSQQEKSLDAKKLFAEKLKSIGIPVLDINTSNDLSVSAKTIYDFIYKLKN